MELIKCQEFEYCVRTIDELISKKTNREEESQIIWRKNDEFLTAKTIRFNQNQVLCYPKFRNADSILENSVDIGEGDKTFITPLRHKLCDFYDLSKFWGDFRAFSDKLVLFDEIMKFVNEFDDEGKNSIGNKIFDVEFLDSNIKIPFLELSSNSELQPICVK